MRVLLKDSAGDGRMNEMLMMKNECYEGQATTSYILEQSVDVHAWL